LSTTPIKLHALGGAMTPPDLGADLLRLLAMPTEAQARLWQALGPCLGDTLTAETEKVLDTFCATHGAAEDDVARVVKASRFLVQSAAKLDVPADRLRADLEALCPDAPRVSQVILAGYDKAKAQIRKRLTAAALLGHGSLLVGAEWRVDTVEASSQGARLGTRVALLTLQIREGDETRRTTIQVLPDMAAELRRFCDEVLPRDDARDQRP
jgi:hypothetical protein